MPVDYRDAAERHWKDAEYLFSDARLANADHLFGLAAECALKAVMHGLGMKLSGDRPEDPRYQKHINILWSEFVSFAASRSGARYLNPLRKEVNPFKDWNVNGRYGNGAAFPQTTVAGHRIGAKGTMLALQAAILDGVVT